MKGQRVLLSLLLRHDTSPEEYLSIEENATGVLPTSGSVFVRVTAACPMTTGRFSRDVVLTFERADGQPVTVDVPEKITVVFECTGPLKLVGQIHETDIFFLTTGDREREQYWSRDAVGTAEHHWIKYEDFWNQADGVSAISEAIEPIGWGDLESTIDLSRTVEPPPPEWNLPEKEPRTVSGHSSLKYHSSYDGTTATWGADFSFSYSQDRAPRMDPEYYDNMGASTVTYFEIAEQTRQNLVITWSCGKFESRTTTPGLIWLRKGPLELFDSENAEGCRYETVLGPGEYSVLVSLGLQMGPPTEFSWSDAAGANAGSYSVTLTYIPPEPT